ncbi:conserved hypothetical protein [Vibrio chagasii]|nr:conserved hypothetical protein [Vibrio chagasii]CAH6916889.1 conserved hypothetical protein [Vibrio chagasii]CAH6949753.1 conserved hypothetical protein [Vibrio chagasii]CAH6964708.1 conserved hypothetical protein [Vibrio chagasii]CAH7005283.1 conserved hypothetical protein [Vibrio chagasii]
MPADDLLKIRRLSKRIKLLAGIEPSSVGKEQASELMLMIMETAEELEKLSDRKLKSVNEKK